jgi:hypothetical protein
VEFRYVSPAVRRGLLVSLASLLVILAGFAWSWRRGRGAGTVEGTPSSGTPAEVS